ncbi:hypothetical protein CRYUN_Cryun12cG0121200 [Craigia yunnanensis]
MQKIHEEEAKLKKKVAYCSHTRYRLIFVAGRVIGYLKKGSTSSLGEGVGIGLVLIIFGYSSLKAFDKRKNSYFALIF